MKKIFGLMVMAVVVLVFFCSCASSKGQFSIAQIEQECECLAENMEEKEVEESSLKMQQPEEGVACSPEMVRGEIADCLLESRSTDMLLCLKGARVRCFFELPGIVSAEHLLEISKILVLRAEFSSGEIREELFVEADQFVSMLFLFPELFLEEDAYFRVSALNTQAVCMAYFGLDEQAKVFQEEARRVILEELAREDADFPVGKLLEENRKKVEQARMIRPEREELR